MGSAGNIIHIGDTVDFDVETENSVSVTFLPLDFFDCWERGSLLSNFAADYFHHNFPGSQAQNLISTVLNELIENAVKFSRNNSMPVVITMKKRKEDLLIRADNTLPKHRQEAFVSICRELFEKNLDELYVQRMDQNVTNSTSSGIGLILIKKDYSAGLDFQFYTDERNCAHVAVTVRLDIETLRNKT